MTAAFLVDAQLPPGLYELLKSQGCKATHVSEVGLGAASDAAIWKRAKDEGAVLISKDEDFALLSRRDPDGPPVVWIRLGNTTNRALGLTFMPLVPAILDGLRRGERLIEVV